MDLGLRNPDQLPIYEIGLDAFHREFRAELQASIAQFPLPPTARILDAGCGDGFYSELLATHVGPLGQVIGLDVNRALLDRARARNAPVSNLTFREGRWDSLSDYRAQFDFVWVAQSLFSFGDAARAIATLVETLKPGGTIAILENDTLHQLLLPWPPELELAIRGAELAALQKEDSHYRTYYVGRRLPNLLIDAGLKNVGFRTQAIDRAAPLRPDLRRYLEDYVATLAKRLPEVLTDSEWRPLAPLFEPAHARYLPGQPNLHLTYLNILAWGQR